MSARREHRLRNLERRVAELETIAATPVFIHTKGDGGEDYVLEAVWSKEEADTHPDKRLSLPTAAWTARGASPSPMTRPRRSPTFPAWRTATASGTLMGM